MIKSTVVTALLLSAAGAGYAQTTGLQVGLKAGLSGAVLDGTINDGASFRTGGHAGVFLRWRPSTRVALQPEVVLSQQGSSNKVFLPGSSVILENKTKLTYLNIPVLLKVYLGNVVNLQFGPQFGVLLGARRAGQVGYSDIGGVKTYRVADLDQKELYKGDIGLCGGLGVDLDNGLLLAARLNYGLTNIDKPGKEIRKQLGLGGLHNRVIEASIGYAFGGKSAGRHGKKD
jgi:hypothetical protein